ncbi:MAG: sigma-70 family RNA polymerase sigma factor [Clostridia bacterium]|nr:sigma-70 family RNA polymerase sigma factor [Clostridia bacterium]
MSILKDEVNKIIANIKKGKPDALRELHNATYGHLKLVAFNYLADRDDIEDVLNDSYFKIYKYVNSANADRDGYNWMCKIVQNLCYDYNAVRGVFNFTDRLSQSKLFYDVEDNLLDNSQLYAAIAKLDITDQEIVYLKFWEDKSLKEIAEKKKMKKSGVYSRLIKIIEILKEQLR